MFPSQLDVKKTRNSDNQEDESNGTGTCVGPSYGIPRQELTKLEMCNLRTRFMEDYTKRKSGVSTDEEDDESACSDEGTSTNGSASTLVSSVGNPPLPADEQPDMCLSYMFLPPWIASPVQTVHSDIQIHVPDKDYVLVDIRRSAEVFNVFPCNENFVEIYFRALICPMENAVTPILTCLILLD